MNEKAEISAKKNIDDFINYYEKQGFNVIEKNYATYKASLEHRTCLYAHILYYKSGVYICLTVN